MSSNEKITFGLVHGSFHGAWCWELLQPKLHKLGHRSVAVDLPTDDPSATFENYADVVAEKFDNIDNLVLVGHSRGGNVIPRVAGRIAVKKLIYLAASFHESTLPQSSDFKSPFRTEEQYKSHIHNIGNELTMFDKDYAVEFFYHDCNKDVAAWAANNLRPQRRSDEEPLLESWPQVPQEFIIATQDRVVNPEWSRYIAKDYLGIEPVEMSCGHSPMLSQSFVLARHLISLAFRSQS